MTVPSQPGYAAYTQGFGTAPAGVSFPVYVNATPGTSFTHANGFPFQPGQKAVWINTGIWELLGFTSMNGILSANWVQISSSSGNVLSVTGTANQITATPNTGNVVVSLPSAITTPGSLTTTGTLTSGATITATSGNITATNGNLVLAHSGNKLVIHATTTSADSVGVSAAMSGDPGAVTVTTSACLTTSTIIYSRNAAGGTLGNVSITTQTTGSFVLTSTSTNETSTFNYLIIN